MRDELMAAHTDEEIATVVSDLRTLGKDGWIVASIAAELIADYRRALATQQPEAGEAVVAHRWLRNGEPTPSGWVSGVPSARQIEAQKQCAEVTRWTVEYAYAAPKAEAQDKRDAERWRFLRKGYVGADFAWNSPPISVLIFEFNGRVSADPDATIDAALSAQRAEGG